MHFTNCANSEKCHKAVILRDLYNNDENHLYLIFLKPILEEMQGINKIFQINSPNPTKQLGDLMRTIGSLKSKVIPPNINIDIFVDNFIPFVQRDLYLGYEFESYLKKKTKKISKIRNSKLEKFAQILSSN